MARAKRFVCLATLVAGLTVALPLAAGTMSSGQAKSGQSGRGETIQESCPLTTDVYTARPKSDHYKGRPGQPVRIGIVLTPRNTPSGFFVSATADAQGEAGRHAAIVPGYPDIVVRFDASGVYVLNVRVSLIAKSSCGGAKAGLLFDGPVRVTVR